MPPRSIAADATCPRLLPGRCLLDGGAAKGGVLRQRERDSAPAARYTAFGTVDPGARSASGPGDQMRRDAEAGSAAGTGAGSRRIRTARPAWTACWLAALLAGCAHRDVVDTPVQWWHQLEGGEIAKQRPPPPGVNDPYPLVGTVPSHAPAVASPALRSSVTEALLRQRNLATRLDANTPLPPPAAPAAPKAGPPPPASPAPPGQAGAPAAGSATLDAAQAKPAATSDRAPDDPQPELALPALDLPPAPQQAAAVLPGIPGAPPAPPSLPGFSAPAGLPASWTPPDYQTAPPPGTQLAFAPGTDTLLSGQRGAIHAVAVRRAGGPLLVTGYGDCASADPDAQTQALSLAALRARAVAATLQQEGVPASAIRLDARAFGRGASLSLVQ